MAGAEWAEMGVGTTEITHHGETNRGGTTADRDQTSDLPAHWRGFELGGRVTGRETPMHESWIMALRHRLQHS